ncbi:hypothetical protein M0R45_007067 [Rubus argutus]|uniref:Uncharacterized protein n=1 Tax=Rubus argutus TaxID=59490 RepID=A0AAW1YSR8_RUBAR
MKKKSQNSQDGTVVAATRRPVLLCNRPRTHHRQSSPAPPPQFLSSSVILATAQTANVVFSRSPPWRSLPPRPVHKPLHQSSPATTVLDPLSVAACTAKIHVVDPLFQDRPPACSPTAQFATNSPAKSRIPPLLPLPILPLRSPLPAVGVSLTTSLSPLL